MDATLEDGKGLEGTRRQTLIKNGNSVDAHDWRDSNGGTPAPVAGLEVNQKLLRTVRTMTPSSSLRVLVKGPRNF